jgi:hypothetical protein
MNVIFKPYWIFATYPLAQFEICKLGSNNRNRRDEARTTGDVEMKWKS